MIRLLLFLIGKRDFESCKSCETLKLQLEIANAEKQELMNTILGIVKPKTYEAPPVEVSPMKPKLAMFSRRRAILEAKDRDEARIIQQSKNIAAPDGVKREELRNPEAGKSVEALEAELGIGGE